MVVISINEGKLRGKQCRDIRGDNFYSFQGIPYAQPPVGHLRFKAPRPVEPWIGVKDATTEGNESMSRHLLSRKIIGSEDCLNLNVYTPQLPEKCTDQRLKPVMFWIHGGVFSMGSNKTELFGPEFLMTEDIVLVTINYRLSILGFLSLDDPSLNIPGNAAFKDMVLALKWVNRNIIHFNGDPNNVTLFGESAGGSAAHLLTLSPMAKGLFHKAICQSGTALSVWVPGRRSARLIAKQMGLYTSDDRKILPFLQNASGRDIVEAQIALDEKDFLETEIRLFGLVVERPSQEEPFLTEHPVDIIRSGNYSHVPLIMGYNNEEGISFDSIVPSKSRNRYFNDLERHIPYKLNLCRHSQVSKQVADRMKMFYFGTENYSRAENLFHYYKMCTDKTFMIDIYNTAKLQVTTTAKPIYFYRFSLESDLNIFKKISKLSVPGVCHGDDVGYLFKTMFTPEIRPGTIEDVGQRRLTRMWANFARFGNPTPDFLFDPLINVTWTPLKKDRFNLLDIDKDLTMKVDPEKERTSFWDEICEINPLCCKL